MDKLQVPWLDKRPVLIRITVGQGPTVPVVGEGDVVRTFFSHLLFLFLSASLWWDGPI